MRIYNCGWCLQDFKDNTLGKRKKYCSLIHRGMFYRNRCTLEEYKLKRTRDCKWCKKPFYAKLGNKKFCNHDCAQKWSSKNTYVPRPRSPKKCLICSKTWTAQSPIYKYCSKPCAHKARNGIKRVATKTHTCQICKSEFQSNHKIRKTCGKVACKRAYARIMGNKSAWIQNHYHATFKRFSIQKICDLCPFEHIDFHHITPTSKGGSDELDNIAFLCPNHHRLTHKGEVDINELRTMAKFRMKIVHKDGRQTTLSAN